MIVPMLPLIVCDIQQGNLQQVTFNKAPNKMSVPKLTLIVCDIQQGNL